MTTMCYSFDFTLTAADITHTQIIDILYPTVVKKYCFQKEQGTGENQYEHFQGRISLITKKRLTEAIKLISPLLPKIHLSTTSTNSLAEEHAFYVCKLDTRIDGPWKDTDPKPVYIPRQIRECPNMRPWQQAVIDDSKIWNTRSINIIVDKTGNHGKSILCQYMEVHGLGAMIPYCNDYKDILRMVCDMPISTCYLIDMPRAINKEKLFQMFSAIETIKSGYAYDDRYHFKKVHFDCPNIWVFTNSLPELSLLSNDRWKIWHIDGQELIPVDFASEKE